MEVNDRLDVDEFVDRLSPALFRYRMAKPIVENPEGYSERIQKGARTKMNNARGEIADLLESVWEVDEIEITMEE